jgi:hypothetical protein
MGDDSNTKGSQERLKINTNEPHGISYWAAKFGVTKQELKKAIDKVGNSLLLLRKNLKTNNVLDVPKCRTVSVLYLVLASPRPYYQVKKK